GGHAWVTAGRASHSILCITLRRTGLACFAGAGSGGDAGGIQCRYLAERHCFHGGSEFRTTRPVSARCPLGDGDTDGAGGVGGSSGLLSTAAVPDCRLAV